MRQIHNSQPSRHLNGSLQVYRVNNGGLLRIQDRQQAALGAGDAGDLDLDQVFHVQVLRHVRRGRQQCQKRHSLYRIQVN